MKNKIDILKNKNKNELFLRKLVDKSFCRKIRYKFENYQGAKLSRIFNLEIKKINRLSIGIIVAICFPLVTNLIAYFGYKKLKMIQLIRNLHIRSYFIQFWVCLQI